jgi:RNA polymerase sigma-70 factor (ECF subfamily)
MGKKDEIKDEAVLLLRLKEGDEEAFPSLFYMFKDKLYGFLLGLAASHEIAEDMVQDVFMRIWQKRAEFAHVENLNGYIFRIAQNHAIDQMRKTANDIILFNSEYVDQPDTSTPNPIDLLMDKELSVAINEAIERLTPQQKKVFTYHRIDGLPHEEIARKMKLSISTVQNHMQRALVSVKAYLEEHYPAISFILSSLLLSDF